MACVGALIIEVRVAQIPTPFCAHHKVTQAMWAWQNAPDAESKEKVHVGLALPFSALCCASMIPSVSERRALYKSVC